MAVHIGEVQIGAFFVTLTQQLRKVTQLDTDDQARTRVHYLSKSANISDSQFNFGHTKANPPLIDSFLADCDHRLSAAEILQLRASNIILLDE